jgi:hypothetical protein
LDLLLIFYLEGKFLLKILLGRMAKTIYLVCRDRTSAVARVRISGDRTVKELKAEVGRVIGKDPEQLVLRRDGRELVDSLDLDTYEMRDGECIEIEYK